ncbi:MAG: hypothetical protein HYY24_18460 [Verrucomicrobia bacterium]|nr:hypothetical protein [Verrucomicrobiota bacterium]
MAIPIPSPKTVEENLGVLKRFFARFKEVAVSRDSLEFIPRADGLQLSRSESQGHVVVYFFAINLRRFLNVHVDTEFQVWPVQEKSKDSVELAPASISSIRLVQSVHTEVLSEISNKLRSGERVRVDLSLTASSRFGAFEKGYTFSLRGDPGVAAIQ